MERIYQYMYEVQCFQYKEMSKESKRDFKMGDAAIVRIYASTADEAIEKAKKLIDKKFYRISIITEYEDHTAMQERQLKIQQDLLKTMNDGLSPKRPWEKE